VLLAAVLLQDRDATGPDDEGAHTGITLAHDVLPRGVALLHGRVRDRVERLRVEVLEELNAFQEIGVRRHGRHHSVTVGIRIEVASDIAACAATVPIQEEIWSGDVVVPPQLLLATLHNGAFVALGYVDGDERAAGFVFGFLGIYDYHFRHHSHMLAVRPAYRGTGLAVALKQAQRDHCLDQGIEIMAWTMDPLEARNARFNFAKLGTYAREYHRDFYGAMPDKLNAGLPSDRLYVEWPIGTDRAQRRLAGEDAPPLEQAEAEGIRYLLRSAASGPTPQEPPIAESHLLLEIPRAFQETKRADPALALAWRTAARDAFEAAFAQGYAAVEFLRSADGRGAYLLVRQPARPGVAGAAGAGAPAARSALR